MERGVPIRSISRCIAVLQAVNRHGALTLMDVARMAKLPYPTACRMIQTLMHEGLIEIEPTRKCYRATALVQTLSQGFDNHDDLVAAARPLMVALTRKVGWPLAITTRVGQSMMVRGTTHDLTSLTFDLYPAGYTMPMLECASGHVYLACAPDDERRNLVDDLTRVAKGSPLLSRFGSESAILQIRTDGYSTCESNSHAGNAATTSTIGVPIHQHGHVVGGLTLAFFTSSMPLAEALEHYLGDMKDTAALITADISREPASGRGTAGGAMRAARAERFVTVRSPASPHEIGPRPAIRSGAGSAPG